MRCKAHYPGDLIRCDLEDLHEGRHRTIIRQDTPTREKGDRVTWDRYWEPRALDEKVIKIFERATQSNLYYARLGVA